MTASALREQLRPYRDRAVGAALSHFSQMAVFYLLSAAAALCASSFLLRFVGSIFAGVASGGLFMIGHDAAHGSYTRLKWLNPILGRLAFLPSYHTFSLWELSHNRIHHVYTNLRGQDFVWTPASKEEYDQMPAWRRALYRLYRTPVGLMFYYPIDLWSKRLFFPSAAYLDRPHRRYVLDSLLVLVWFVMQILACGVWTPTDVAGIFTSIGYFVAIPYLVFSWMIGFVIYFNHTHPRCVWFANREEWSFLAGAILGTACLKFPSWTHTFTSDIMDHIGHHVDPGVPLVRLPEAHARLNELLPGYLIVQRWSWSSFLDTLTRCKLYDYENHGWVDYDGRPTTVPLGRLENLTAALEQLPDFGDEGVVPVGLGDR